MSKDKGKEKDFKKIDLLIVKTKVKEYIKSLGDYNVSEGFYEEFNIVVAGLVKKAAQRATKNNRKTVSGKDAE